MTDIAITVVLFVVASAIWWACWRSQWRGDRGGFINK